MAGTGVALLTWEMEGWWIVAQIARPVEAIRFIPRITIEAARASSPEVGSAKDKTRGEEKNGTNGFLSEGACQCCLPSKKMILGFATSSTAMESRLRCSNDNPPPASLPTRNP